MNTSTHQQSTGKNKIFTYAILFIVFLSILGGWWYAQNKAEEEIRMFFDEREYLDDVSYEDVTFNPITGTLTLSQIEIEPTIKGLENTIVIDTLKIYNMEIDRSLPKHIHFSVIGVHANLLDNAKAFFSPAKLNRADKPMKNLLILGYYELLFDYEMEVLYDEDKPELSIQIYIGADGLGKIELQTKITQLNKHLFRIYDCVTDVISNEKLNSLGGNFHVKFRKCDTERAVSYLTNSRLAELRMSGSDDGFFKRYKHHINIKHFYQTGEHIDEAKFYNQESIRKHVIKLKQLGASREIAENLVETMANFMNDPGKISIETNIEKPILVKRLYDEDIGKIFSMTHVKASN